MVIAEVIPKVSRLKAGEEKRDREKSYMNNKDRTIYHPDLVNILQIEKRTQLSST